MKWNCWSVGYKDKTFFWYAVWQYHFGWGGDRSYLPCESRWFSATPNMVILPHSTSCLYSDRYFIILQLVHFFFNKNGFKLFIILTISSILIFVHMYINISWVWIIGIRCMNASAIENSCIAKNVTEWK